MGKFSISSFLSQNWMLILIFVFGIVSLGLYSQSKFYAAPLTSGMGNRRDVSEESQESAQSGSVEPSQPLGTNEDYAKVQGITTSTSGLSPSCTSVSSLEPSELLPKDQNSEWAKLNPTGQGELGEVNLLKAGHHAGINTVAGQAMRNSNLQLRSDPPIARTNVGPFLNSTIEPDTHRLQFEIGSAI